MLSFQGDPLEKLVGIVPEGKAVERSGPLIILHQLAIQLVSRRGRVQNYLWHLPLFIKSLVLRTRRIENYT